MTRDQYQSLWNVLGESRNFTVLRANDDKEYGFLCISPDINPDTLLQRGKERGFYPQDSFLIEWIEDFYNIAEGVDIN